MTVESPTKIGLLNHIGGGNLGDDATLEAVASNIRRRSPNVELVAFSMNPHDTETRHAIISYPIRRRGWSLGYGPPGNKATLKAAVKALIHRHSVLLHLLRITNAMISLPCEVLRELSFIASSRRDLKFVDLLIICGGGQLTEKDGPWGFPYTIFKWVLLARSAGIRCIFLNVGAGPLTRPLGKFFVMRALLAADYVSLRDTKSQTLLYKIGLAGETQVYPDSVYGLDTSSITARRVEPRALSIVGFAPMPYPDRVEYPAKKEQLIYNEFMNKLASFASWLVRQSYGLTFFGTDIGVDPLAIADVQQALVTHHDITASQYRLDQSIKSTHALLESISAMDYVVTCRFHGVVFAHLLNKPVLAIAHHPKVRDAMEDLGLSSYCVDIRDFDEKVLVEKFELMVVNAEKIKQCMARRLTRNRERLRSQFDMLFGVDSAERPPLSGIDASRCRRRQTLQ
jgi:polysaccharide pyruvyl transferase WcaK-like protein